MSNKEYQDDRQGAVIEKTRRQLKAPRLYKVLLHNDDYTTMDFVIMVLQTIFNKDITTATEIMMSVHKSGVGVAGLYTRDVAETKVLLVREQAKKNEHPLRCSMERC